MISNKPSVSCRASHNRLNRLTLSMALAEIVKSAPLNTAFAPTIGCIAQRLGKTESAKLRGKIWGILQQFADRNLEFLH